MTITDTALVTVTAARKALAKKGRKLSDIVRAVHVASGRATAIELAVAEPPLPTKPAVTDDVKRALAVLVDKINAMRVPTQRTTLSAAQQQAIGEALEQLKVLQGFIDDVTKETIRRAVFNHFDVEAERKGTADAETPRDKDGYYLLPGSIKLDTGAEVKREPSAGQVKLTAEDLYDLVLAQKLDPKVYRAITRQVRVIDEDAALSYLERDPSLAVVLQQASRVSGGSVALRVR